MCRCEMIITSVHGQQEEETKERKQLKPLKVLCQDETFCPVVSADKACFYFCRFRLSDLIRCKLSLMVGVFIVQLLKECHVIKRKPINVQNKAKTNHMK